MLGLPSVGDGTAGNRALFIAAAVGVLLLVPLEVFVQQFHAGLRSRTVSSPLPSIAASEAIEDPGIGPLALESKYNVRLRDFVGTAGYRFDTPPAWPDVVERIERLAATRTERVRSAIVAAELLGQAEGLRRLDALEQEATPGGALAGDIYWLKRAYTEGREGLTAEAEASLKARHGWFGALAVARGNSTAALLKTPESEGGEALVRTFSRLGLMNLALAVVGVIAAASLFAFWRNGFFESAAFEKASHPEVYLEAFNIFLLLFIVLVGVQVLSMWTTGSVSVAMFVVVELLLWTTALGVVWPWLRGVPADEAAQDLGWTRGEGIGAEMLCGALAFLASIPVLWIVGMVVRLGVDAAGLGAAEEETIGFPSYRRPLGNSWIVLWAGTLSAVVWAPLVEETFYRGAMYRAVRERLGPWVAVPLTAVAFGVAHPYSLDGLIIVSIAGVGFALLREWRGSLIAPVTMHVLHNGFIQLQEISVIAAID